jgi:hypothetical protein
MENLPTFFVLFNVCSATFPRFGAAAGALWVVGRALYHAGYAKGGPTKRLGGLRFSYPSFFAMVFSLLIRLTVALRLNLRFVPGVRIDCISQWRWKVCSNLRLAYCEIL